LEEADEELRVACRESRARKGNRDVATKDENEQVERRVASVTN
jgi:hypothetical protein